MRILPGKLGLSSFPAAEMVFLVKSTDKVSTDWQNSEETIEGKVNNKALQMSRDKPWRFEKITSLRVTPQIRGAFDIRRTAVGTALSK